MFVDSAAQARNFFVDVFEKIRGGSPLEPLEAIVASIIDRHPEYHDLLADRERALAMEFPADPFANPFFHLSLHVALAEQLDSDRPRGIRDIRERALRKGVDPHRLEHAMIELLAETLMAAQHTGQPPDELLYLEQLQSRVTRL